MGILHGEAMTPHWLMQWCGSVCCGWAEKEVLFSGYHQLCGYAPKGSFWMKLLLWKIFMIQVSLVWAIICNPIQVIIQNRYNTATRQIDGLDCSGVGCCPIVSESTQLSHPSFDGKKSYAKLRRNANQREHDHGSWWQQSHSFHTCYALKTQ